jgi:hypothetical protein
VDVDGEIIRTIHRQEGITIRILEMPGEEVTTISNPAAPGAMIIKIREAEAVMITHGTAEETKTLDLATEVVDGEMEMLQITTIKEEMIGAVATLAGITTREEILQEEMLGEEVTLVEITIRAEIRQEEMLGREATLVEITIREVTVLEAILGAAITLGPTTTILLAGAKPTAPETTTPRITEETAETATEATVVSLQLLGET